MRNPGPQGLGSEEASRRLQIEGYNELPARHRRGLLKSLIPLLSEPMIVVLFACSGAYFWLGDPREAWVLLASVVFVSGITLYQEHRTERTLEALQDLSAPRALVLRGGIEQRIPGKEVVRGDLLILREGDRVAADAVIQEAYDLQADESLLTGESYPAVKLAQQEVFSGTVLTRGRGLAEVVRTGSATRLGKIGSSLQKLENSPTRLQASMNGLAKRLAIGASFFCVLVTLLYVYRRGDWLNGVLAGLTLSVALMPEELPVILTVFFAMGAWRISRQNVLTRRLSAIEALGTVQILGTDKTGTLTLNQMTVRKLWFSESGLEQAASLGVPFSDSRGLAQTAWLACPLRSFDPMDRAVNALLKNEEPDFADKYQLRREFPLTPSFLATTQIWKTPSGMVAFAKGAPEQIASLCRLTNEERVRMDAQIARWAQSGLRILGVAQAQLSESEVSIADPHLLNFRLQGLLGFVDPPRENVPQALRECRSAGIRVVMITGDHPATAAAIAREIGLSPQPRVITGAELSRWSEAELSRELETIQVFARISPEQKLRIVQAYQKQNRIVAMTGDGVNDGPSLKAAHVGIAMGGRGTDLAREAAALVVLDDNFATIIAAIRLGRTIFANIKKAIAYVIAIHIPIAGTALLPLLFGGPTLLLPIHVVFLELIIDPACSLVFEASAPETRIMQTPPRAPRTPLFSRREFALNIVFGCLLFMNVATVHYIGKHLKLAEPQIRTLCFATLVLGNLALILTDLSRSSAIREIFHPKNRLVGYLLACAVGLLLASIYVTPISEIFKLVPLSPYELGALSGLTLFTLSLMNFLKTFPDRK